MSINSFTIRVYGLLIKEDQILLSRENIKGEIHTKFPGGGLEFGEGITDCLRREFMEEVEIRLSALDFYFFNEDFVASIFHTNKQVLSIYYKVQTDELEKIATGDPENEEILAEPGSQVLYWCPLKALHRQAIELPVDRKVAAKILAEL